MNPRVKTVLISATLVTAGIYACKSANTSAVKEDPIGGGASADDAANGVPGTFAHTWAHVKQGAYDVAPQYKVTLGSFFQAGQNMLAVSTSRTLAVHDDVLPHFQKLVHPLGICYAGTWTIDRDLRDANNQAYTGYFANGATGQIIMRASEAFGNTTVGSYRAFGWGGKIFPSTDPNNQVANGTANFFVIDDFAGTKATNFLDLPKTNEPPVTLHPSDLLIGPMLAEVVKTFISTDSHPTFREVYEISELGHMGGPAVTPHWMGIRADTADRVPSTDFRDEMRLANYPGGLKLGIYVSYVKDVWDRIGSIALTDESLSDGCDHQLHFHHPPFK